jgi:hypothetical protein
MVDPLDDDVKNARMIRWALVHDFYREKLLDRAGAIEILKGPLKPDDESTVVDDSALLDIPSSELVAILIYGDQFKG